MWRRIRALIYKEWQAVWRDRKSRYMLVVPPLVQLVIFALAATLDVTNVPIGILNRDYGKQAWELVQRFEGAPTFSKIVHLQAVEEIQPFLDNKEGVMVLSIDEQFSRNLDAGKPAALQMLLDGRKSNTAQIVAGYATSIVDQFNIDWQVSNEVQVEHAALVVRNWYNPNLLYYWYNVPCLCGVLTMVEAIMIAAMSVARERELGTFDQLLVSPLRPAEVLLGKVLPAMAIAMGAGTLILVAGILVYQVPFTGSLLALYWSMTVFVCSVVGIGLFISSLCSTQQQAILGSFVFSSPSISLSGFATPIENMPEWLQPLTYAIPLRYFLVVTKGSFLKAMPWDVVWENTWPMAIIAIINLTAATWFFRHKLQ